MTREELIGQLAGTLDWIGYQYALASQKGCEEAAFYLVKWLEKHDLLKTGSGPSQTREANEK
jgi:hypothetical protein